MRSVLVVVFFAFGATAAAQTPDPTVAEVEARLAAAIGEVQTRFELRVALDDLKSRARELEPTDRGPDPFAGTPAARPDPCPRVEQQRTDSAPSPWADGITVVRGKITLSGPVPQVVCGIRELIGDGRLVELSRVELRSTRSGATAVVDALEWRVEAPPTVVVPPPPAAEPLAAGASRKAHSLARELERFEPLLLEVARLRAEKAALVGRVERLEALGARLAASQWHAAVLKAAAAHPATDLQLDLTPGSGRVTGAEYRDDGEMPLRRIAVPAGVSWDASGLVAPRPLAVTLPVVLDAGTALRIDAYDAPAHGLAVLLGQPLISGPRSGPRFTGRISAADKASALAALTRTVPALTGFAQVPSAGAGEPIDIRIIDARAADLVRLLKRVSKGPVKGCAIELPVTLGVRRIPVGAVVQAVEALFAAEPRCAGTPLPPTPLADDLPSVEIEPGWRLVATLIEGPDHRTALFVDGAGTMQLVHGHYNRDGYLHLGPGRLVSVEPRLYLLGEKD